MRILFTGASSFTGYWFVKTLAAQGHEVVCPVTGSLERYEGVRRRRVEQLLKQCQFIPGAPFGSDAFLRLARGEQWDLLCHHAAEMANYRSPQFDALEALGKNTLNLPAVLGALQERGLKAVVLTGSVFENDEGIGNEPLRAFSPYGLSKGLTSQVFRHYCGQGRISLFKFVIPNPFGPFEEERFTAYLMRHWREEKAPTVKTPAYIRDNIHADLLALAYAKCVDRAANAKHSFRKVNPSGYVESQGAFALRVAREVKARTGWACEVDLARQEDFSEPLMRVNHEPAAQVFPGWNECAAWDAFVEFYRGA